MATAAEIIETARSKLGARYVFGAEGPDTFDCSGLMQWSFGQHGIRLPRTSAEQATVGSAVRIGDQRPGDLIFSSWDGSPGVDHVALYIGNGEYIQAPRPGRTVEIGRLTDNYLSHVTGVRRVLAAPGGGDDGGGIGGVIGDVGDAVGGALGGDLVDAVRAGAQALRSVAGGVVQVGDLAKKAAWLALPTTQVRLVSGALGIGFLLVGVWFLVREVRQ